jgi:hypothetical protein
MAINSLAKEIEYIDKQCIDRTKETIAQHKVAVANMSETYGTIVSTRLSESERKKDAHEHRIDVVLSLKNELSNVSTSMKKTVDKKSRKKQQVERDLRMSKEHLISIGLNPYSVFRQRAIDEEVSAAERNRIDNESLSRSKILEDMVKEESRLKKIDAGAALAKVLTLLLTSL